ncbi:hypothetical protein FA95DRAFT_1601236 [Auriscalpium vulgare]|uniref:Uncharacterized protein n=1 Tax=Auriscalpium vulgare TaxID=40419 RepID=A0ACB8S9N9_9AGAM|nr:hypothetical protein FA95DRAFT_1601236 [Auriscalpium vulgare]
MRFFVAPLAIAAACLSAVGASPSVIASRDVDLGTWLFGSILTFFPNHTGWDAGYEATFAPTLKATFNQNKYDYKTLKELYTGIHTQMTTKYTGFAVNITSAVIVPNANDLGGLITLTGDEGGVPTSGGGLITAPDSAFGVVSEINGRRWITEWRETTDFVL